jgi:hypothetical protein
LPNNQYLVKYVKGKTNFTTKHKGLVTEQSREQATLDGENKNDPCKKDSHDGLAKIDTSNG